jgi:hypothetical protein
MSRIVRPLAAVASVVGCLALPAGALGSGGRGAPDLNCTTTATTPFYSGTYNNVTVPADQTCELTAATVLGNVTVQTDASVDLENSGSVGGSLLVGNGGSAFEDSRWVIAGAAAANNAGSLSFTGTIHGIVGTGTGTLALSSATVDGSIIWNKGLYGGVIGSSVITGQVVLNGTTGDPTVGGLWVIAGPQLDGSPQEIDGNVVLTNNQVPIYVFDNHIKQSLVCAGNNPAPFTSLAGSGNTVDGRSLGQCAAPNPATGATADAARAAQVTG